ncbi:MAG: T9SS type A sorting domain-containing protein, partial [Chloroherpetonaceae bacterium]
TSNSGLPNNWVYSIAIDKNGSKWIGTIKGLAKYDGTSWTIYNTSNSGLPRNGVISITIDKNSTKWLGTDGGLVKYDGTWTIYDTLNSDIPDNTVYTIAIEVNNTKWIGTNEGMAAYNENGIPSSVNENILPEYNISIFPNPANDYLKIEQSEADISFVEIINLQGQVIKSQRILGNQSILDLTNLSTGVYILKIYTNSGFIIKKLIKQ